NTRRIRAALSPLLAQAPLSKSAVSRLVARLEEGYQAWQKRDLAAERIVYLYLDAIYLKVRSGGKVVSLPVLVALGVRAGGEKVTVQRIVHVGDRLAFAIRLAGQIVVRIVGVGLAQGRREIRLRDPAEGIVGKKRGMPVRVQNARQIVFGVVGVRRHVIRSIGDAGQPVGVVIDVAGRLPVLIGHRSPPPAVSRILSKSR